MFFVLCARITPIVSRYLFLEDIMSMKRLASLDSRVGFSLTTPLLGNMLLG